jgi:hypothetical protein
MQYVCSSLLTMFSVADAPSYAKYSSITKSFEASKCEFRAPGWKREILIFIEKQNWVINIQYWRLYIF